MAKNIYSDYVNMVESGDGTQNNPYVIRTN